MTLNAPQNEPPEPGGKHRRPTGFSASELLLAGVGACSAWDVVEVLRKKRQRLVALDVRVDGEQDADPPWAYRRISVQYTARGHGLDEAVVRRAVRLSVDRYCSVIATVRGGAEVVDSVEVVEEPGAPAA